jgi:nucleotide-binding universal stress UspA family protein
VGADVIVLGSHGRSGIARLMLGSVAARVVAESPIPVLVCR